MIATIANTFESTIAQNLLQLQEEGLGRQRRIALRDRANLSMARADWWKKPLLWAILFSNIIIARDTFLASLVDLIVSTV